MCLSPEFLCDLQISFEIDKMNYLSSSSLFKKYPNLNLEQLKSKELHEKLAVVQRSQFTQAYLVLTLSAHLWAVMGQEFVPL